MFFFLYVFSFYFTFSLKYVLCVCAQSLTHVQLFATP